MKDKRGRAKRSPGKAKGAVPKIDSLKIDTPKIDAPIDAPTPVINRSFLSKIALLAPWIVTLWLLAMTGWYVYTAVEALKHPISKGNDVELVKLWIMLVASVVVSHAIFMRRFVTIIWLVALLAIGGTMIVSSQSVTAVLIVVWLLALSWVWGDWLLRRTGANPSGVPFEWGVVAVSAGLAVLALLGLALCTIRRLNATWIWGMLIILTVLQLRGFWRALVEFNRFIGRQLASGRARSLIDHGAVAVVVGIVALFNLTWALAPEIQYDALNYHLPAPRLYLAEQRLVFASITAPAHLVEMLYAFSLALQGQTVAKLLTFSMIMITALAIYAIGKGAFNSEVGLWGAALFYCTPLVSWLSSTTYIDGVVAMFLASTLLAFLRWRQTQQNGWLWVCGILTGATAGAKMTGLLGLPVIFLLVLWGLFRTRSISITTKLKSFSGYLLSAVLVGASWYVLPFIRTGNPFFPLLNGVFRSPLGRLENLNSNAGAYTLGPSRFAILNLPFAFTFQTDRFGEGLSSGGLGFALALFPLALFLLLKRHGVAAILFAAAAVYLLLLGHTMPYGRYYIPTLPVVVVLGAAAVIHQSSVNWLKQLNLLCVGIVVIAQASLIPLMFWAIPERVPLGVALGAESREAFLLRAVPFYSAVQFVNRRTPSDKRVIGIGLQSIRFYLNPTMFSPYEMEPYLNGSTPQEMAASLSQNDFTFLIIDTRSREADIPIPYIRQSFLSRHAELEYTANGTDVYRLLDSPVDQTPATNLLPNPGFETTDPAGFPAGWLPFGHPQTVRDENRAHSGQIAVRVDSTNGLFVRLPVEPGKIYSLEHWSRADRPGQFARLQINWLDANLQTIGVSIDVVAATTQWAPHHFSVLVPESTSLAAVLVSVHENGEVWFDDYTFVKGQLRTPQ